MSIENFYKGGLTVNITSRPNNNYKSIKETNQLIRDSVRGFKQPVQENKSYNNTLRYAITEELKKQYGH